MKNALLNASVAILAIAVIVLGALLWHSSQPGRDKTATSTQTPAAGNKITASALRAKLKTHFGTPDKVVYEPETNLYRVRIGSRIVYVTADGKYLIHGSVYDIDTRENLTSRAKDGLRKQVLASINPASLITYSPQGETKYVVWAFVDVTCPYCQKMHDQIGQYTALGIKVHYLAYPRAGPNSSAWKMAESAWCASDRKQALTQAFAMQSTVGPTDCNNPVATQYRDGKKVGLRGTPMIISANGAVLGGYLSPERMLHKLKASS